MPINLFQFVLSFVCNGIEIVMFFLVIRMLRLWKPVQWIEAFDNAGRTLADGVAGFVDRSVYRLWKKHLMIKSRLLLAFILLELCRTILIQTCQCI